MPIKHLFVSSKPDGGDNTLVQPGDWNDDHTGIKVVRKTADETVTGSTTLQNDDQLLFAVAANEAWIFELWVVFDGDASGDAKFSLVGPTGCTILWNAMVWPTTFTGTEPLYQYYATAGGDASAKEAGTIGAGFGCPIHIKGTIVNAATAADLNFRWAQKVATGSLTVKANSWLKAFKV